MKLSNQPQEGTHIIAVSGGVDSVVLLDMLASANSNSHLPIANSQLIVAHFDHGIRPDSASDEQFVAKLARQYGLKYDSQRQELGPDASEATARQARYNFLFKMKARYNAQTIMTAHHSDDVVETMILNLLRGTGWRGLCSLKNTDQINRPLLAFSKQEIKSYAIKHKLAWREDPTNTQLTYLRNQIRHQVVPHVDRAAWLQIYRLQKKIAKTIDKELSLLSENRRHHYIMWPQSVSLEMIRSQTGVTRVQAKRALTAIKTARQGTTVTIGERTELSFTRERFVVTPL